MLVERESRTDTSPLSPQLLQELRDPTLTFRLLGSPRYGGGEMDRGPGGAAGVELGFCGGFFFGLEHPSTLLY